MNVLTRQLALVMMICGILNWVSWTVVAAPIQGLSSQHPPELAVLDNGQMLAGWVTRTADSVAIQTAQGSRVVLPARRVVTICHTIEEVYDYRFQHLDPENIAGHITLLHWCLKHNLQASAENQIDVLMGSNLDADRLMFLDQKVTKAFQTPEPKHSLDVELAFTRLPMWVQPNDQPPEHATQLLGSGLAATASQPAFDHRPKTIQFPMPKSLASEKPLPAFESQVAPVSFEETLEDETNAPALVSTTELDSITRAIHKDELRLFQRKIQPMLLRGCSATKCHGSNAQTLPLLQRGRGQLVPKRFTQRNLYATLLQIDPQQPANSPLLTAVSTAHAGADQPLFSKESEEFQQLNAWVQALASRSSHVLPRKQTAAQQAKHVPATAVQPLKPISDDRQRLVPLLPTQMETAQTDEPQPDAPRVAAIPDIRRGRKVFQPIDPFDPELFHRLTEQQTR